MKKAILIFSILFVSFCQISFAQDERDYHLDKDNLSFFKEAELVVEGRFLKPLHAYAVKDADGKEHYYGICPVIAYRVFKGDAKPGDTIYVTREGTSLEEAIASPYDYHDIIEYDSITGQEYIIHYYDVMYIPPMISRKYKLHALDHFQTDCIMFFKASFLPKATDNRYSSQTQYQYLYPYVFYDEGTKLYVSGNKFAGLNDTLFNTRQELYDFMRKVGGYDTTVIGSGTPQKVQTYSNETHHKVIQCGPPSKAPDNSKWTSSGSAKPLPPEVEKRWGKEAKKKSKSRKKQH